MNQARRQVLKGLLLAPTLALLSSCGSSFDEPVVGGTTSTPPNGAAAVISAEEAARLILSRRVLVLAAESKAESGPLQLLGGAVPVDVDQLTTFSEQPGALLDPTARRLSRRCAARPGSRARMVQECSPHRLLWSVHLGLPAGSH